MIDIPFPFSNKTQNSNPKPQSPGSSDDIHVNDSVIGPDTEMIVTGLLHRGNEKAVCIYISENDKSVEIRMPAGEILSRNRYSDSDIEEIISYLNDNMRDIEAVASGINPMKAFMGR